MTEVTVFVSLQIILLVQFCANVTTYSGIIQALNNFFKCLNFCELPCKVRILNNIEGKMFLMQFKTGFSFSHLKKSL